MKSRLSLPAHHGSVETDTTNLKLRQQELRKSCSSLDSRVGGNHVALGCHKKYLSSPSLGSTK